MYIISFNVHTILSRQGNTIPTFQICNQLNHSPIIRILMSIQTPLWFSSLSHFLPCPSPVLNIHFPSHPCRGSHATYFRLFKKFCCRCGFPIKQWTVLLFLSPHSYPHINTMPRNVASWWTHEKKPRNNSVDINPNMIGHRISAVTCLPICTLITWEK